MAEFTIPGPSFDRKESSPAGSLRAIIRRARAEAWDEGYEVAMHEASGDYDLAAAPVPTNPYRATQTEKEEGHE